MKSFAKCRTSIAGMYENRGYVLEAENAYLQAIELSPSGAESTMRLANMYMKQERFDDALKIVTDLKKKQPEEKRIDGFITYIQNLKKQKEPK